MICTKNGRGHLKSNELNIGLKMLNADALRRHWDRWKLWQNRSWKPSKFVLAHSVLLLAWNKNIWWQWHKY